MASEEYAPALQVDGLGKTYRLWSSPASRLWVPLAYRLAGMLAPLPGVSGWLRRRAGDGLHSHRALHDIRFSLRRGDALGIIGHNGSGKSTLLQIIAGVLPATEGTVQVNGRVAALLELGSGFNPELSGRENVRVNAAILGLTPTQIRERMDDIVDFADIDRFIDEPVKTYSSGMAVRLAFAVQVHTDPDILIVDEALAVGDAAFQAKAMARIDEILRRGTTLLFVGHDLNAVKAFCHRAILLDKGCMVMEGLPDEVITEYLHRTHTRTLEALGYQKAQRLQKLQDGFGFDDARVVEARLNGAEHVAVAFDAALDLAVTVRMRPDIAHPLLILDVMDGRGLQLTGRRIALPRVEEVGNVELRVGMRAAFQKGVYRFRLRLLDSADLHQHVVLARHEGIPSFEVVDDSREHFTGLFPVPIQVDIRHGASTAPGAP